MASPLPSPACLPFVPSPTGATANPSAAASSSYTSDSAPATSLPSNAAARCAATAARGRVRTTSTAAVASSCSLWEMRRDSERDRKEGPAAVAGRGLFSKQFLPRGTVILSSQTPLVWTAACSSNACCCGTWPPSPHSSSTSSYSTSSSNSNNESTAHKNILLLREKHRADQLTPCAYCLAPPNHVTSSYPTFRMQQQSRRYDARGKALRCSGCSCTFYCSAACQRDAWAEHRRECPIIHCLFIWSRGAFPTPTQRLLIRLLLQNVSLEAFTAGPRRTTQSLFVSLSPPAEAASITAPAAARQRQLKAAEIAATAYAAAPAAGAAAPNAGAAVPAVSAAAPTAETAAAVALPRAGRAEGRTEKDVLTERDGKVACASPKGESEGETTWRMSLAAAAATDERGASSAQGSPDAVEAKATHVDTSSIEEQRALLQFEQQLQEFIDVFETAVKRAAAAAAKAATGAQAAANAEAAANAGAAVVAATAAAEGRRTTQAAVAAGGATWKEEGAVTGVAARKAAAAAAGRTAAGEGGTSAAAAAATAARAKAIAIFAEQVCAAGSATLKTAAAKITRNGVSVLLCAEEGEVCCSTAAAAAHRSRRRDNAASSCLEPRNSGSRGSSSIICMGKNSTSSSSTGHRCSSGSNDDQLRDKSSSRDLGTSASSSSKIMTLDSIQSGSSKCSCCFRGSQCAVGLYPPPLCWVNHACNSNAVLIFGAAPQRLSVSLVAARDIWKGEEIFISYTPRMQPQQQRKETLLSIYGFLCQCALCCCFLRSPQSLVKESKKRQQQVEALQQTQQQQITQEAQKEKPQQREQHQHDHSNVEKKQHQEEFQQVDKKRWQRQRNLNQQQLQGKSEENQYRDGETADGLCDNEEEGGYSSSSNSACSSSSTNSSTSSSSTSNSRMKMHEEEGCCAAEAFDKQLICLFCPSPSCMCRCCTTQGDALLMLDAAASQQSSQQQQNLQSNQVSEQRQQLTDEEQQGQQQQLRMPLLLVYGRGSCVATSSSTTDVRGARASSNTGPRVISLVDEDTRFAGCAAVSLSDLCSRLLRSRVDSRYSSSCTSSECESNSRLHEASRPHTSTSSSSSYSCSNTPGSCTSSTGPGDNTSSTAENNSSSSGIRFSDGTHRSSRWGFSDTSSRAYNFSDRHITSCYTRDSSSERLSSICNAANSNSLISNTSSSKEKATGDRSVSVRCGVCRRDVPIDVLFAVQAAYDAIEDAFAAFLDGKPDTHMAAVAAVRAAAAAAGSDAAAAAGGSRRAAEKFGAAADGDMNAAYQFSSSWLQFYWLLYGCTHPGNRYLYELREQLLLPSLLAYRDFYVPSALLLAIHQTRAAAAAHGQWTEEMALALEREGRLLLAIAQDAKNTTDRRNVEAAMACYVWQVAEERTNLLHDTVDSNCLKEKFFPHVTTERLLLTLPQQHSQQEKHMLRQQTQHHMHRQRQQKQNPAEILLLHSCKSLTRACTIRCSLQTTPASHTRELERTLYDCRAELQEIYREKGGETII